MKRLKAPLPGATAERGTQITALKVLPARNPASARGPSPALAPAPAASSATDTNIPMKAAGAVTTAAFIDVSLRGGKRWRRYKISAIASHERRPLFRTIWL